MKKLTLTFCALFALIVVAPALYADGPEKYSGKEKEVMQPAPPVCDFYRAHEWDLDIWGAYAFAADTGHKDVPNDDPFMLTGTDTDVLNITIFEVNGTVVSTTTTESTQFNPNEHLNIGRYSNNSIFGRDETWGGGVDAKYFWSRYFGAGIEGFGLAAKTNFAGAGLGTLTLRYPFGRFSPYVVGGLGVLNGGSTLYKYFNEKPFNPNNEEFWSVDPVYDNYLRGIGQLGVGLEYRVTCHLGLMADFSWNFVFGRNEPDLVALKTEQGIATTTTINQITGPAITNAVIQTTTTTTSTTVTNTGFYIVPGRDSDHQDFGMVRFGVTFSY